MSYQVLARKYRPADFTEMVGQEHVLQALINALDQNRLHHAYLFTGTRGVGKTTIARILAKCLNCDKGVSSAPCGQCESCLEIASGRSIDLIEVDAASRTGVDDTRELLENVQYMPSKAKYKIYLIDEVHMFSRSSFNALLKTLEEPPEHVKFLLATTDPKKLPVTVLSRCLQFNLRNMTPEKIVTHLQQVLEAEQVTFEERALWQLGRAADGSMRDALSLTDQAIAHSSGNLTDQAVLEMLGGVDQREIYHMLEALVAEDAAALLAQVGSVARYSPDFSALLADLLSLLHRITVAQAVPDAVDNSYGDQNAVRDFAQRISAEDLHLYYQIGLIGQRDLPLAPDAQAGFEMTLLRMMAFRPAAAGEDASATVESTPAPVSTRATAAPTSRPTQSAASNSRQRSRQAQDVLAAIGSADSGGGGDPTKKPEGSSAPDTRRSAPSIPETSIAAPATGTAQPASAVADIADPDDKAATGKPMPDRDVSLELAALTDTPAWAELLAELDVNGVALNLASNCRFTGMIDSECQLQLGEQHASLWSENYEQRIAAALSGYFGRELTVKITLAPNPGETPARFQESARKELLEQALATIRQDEKVQRLLEDFDGQLVVESVRPGDQSGLEQEREV